MPSWMDILKILVLVVGTGVVIGVIVESWIQAYRGTGGKRK